MNKKFLSVEGGLVEGNHLYVIDADTWLFLDYDINTGACELKADIQPDDYYRKLCWVEKILHVGNEFFILIRNYRGLVSVSEGGDVVYYESDHELGTDNSFYYIDMLAYDDLIYVFPGYTGGVISVFDPEAHEYTKHFSLEALFDRDMTQYRDNSIWSYIYSEEGVQARFCINNTNMICTLDFRKMSIRICSDEAGSDLMMLSGTFGNTVALENNSYRLFRYFEEKNEIEIIGDFSRKKKDDNWYGYQMAFVLDDMIAGIPEDMDSIEFIREGQIIRNMQFPKESDLIYEIRNYKGKFGRVLQDNKKAYLLPFSTNGLIVFDMDTNGISFLELLIPQEILMVKNMKNMELIRESKEISLSGFIQNIKLSHGIKIKNMDMRKRNL